MSDQTFTDTAAQNLWELAELLPEPLQQSVARGLARKLQEQADTIARHEANRNAVANTLLELIAPALSQYLEDCPVITNHEDRLYQLEEGEGGARGIVREMIRSGEITVDIDVM